MREATIGMLAFFLVGTAAWASEAERYRAEWILVQLEQPLAAADGVYSLQSGRAELDAAIADELVQRIDHALPVSMARPRDPAALARHGLDRTYRFHLPAGADPRRVARRFHGLPGVEFAEPDFLDSLTMTNVPDDPLFPQQWAYDQPSDADVDGPEAWAVNEGAALVVGILDSGLQLDHPEFAGKVAPGFDFVENDATPQDELGHGTPVSSVAAAATDDGTGMAGTCWGCRIMPLRIFDADGNGTIQWFADAVVWGTDQGADVLNHSGQGSNSQLRLDAIRYARDHGVLFVNSAGNGIQIPFPAQYREAFSVGASNDQDEKASFSSFGDYLEVLAPGESMLVANLDAPYSFSDGTSFSAPLVAGQFALIKSVYPHVGREEGRQIIHASAEDQVGNPADDIPGWDEIHGFGRVNLHRSLLVAQAVTTLRVDDAAATRVYFDTPNPVADSYDFIRGDLSALGAADGTVGLGPVVCLENDSVDPDTVGDEDVAVPASGAGFFYLARFNYGPWPGSFGGSSDNLDRTIPDPPSVADWSVSPAESDTLFGANAGAAGDVDGDGFGDLIVGARDFPAAGGGTGAAFVYHGSAAGLAASPATTILSTQEGSGLGFRVATAGNVNGDAYDDVIIGEFRFDGVEDDEGRAYVHLGSAAGIDPTPHRTLRDPQKNARFGFRVGTAGDVNDDGFDDVFVVAQRYDGGHNDEGKVYVYHGSASGIPALAAWTFEPDQTTARLGTAQAAGDVNGDGFDDLVVGAALFDGAFSDEGRVWVFHGSMAGLSATPDRVLAGSAEGMSFGSGAGGAGNVDGDAHDDVVITASGYANGEEGEGGAWLYLGSPSGLVSPPSWSFESDQVRAGLRPARAAGDVNGDGFDDLLVSSQDYGVSRLGEGRVWLFHGGPSGLAAAPAWSELGWQLDARLGSDTGSAGNVDGDAFDDLFVGASAFDAVGHNEGAVFVWHGRAGAPAAIAGHACETPAP